MSTSYEFMEEVSIAEAAVSDDLDRLDLDDVDPLEEHLAEAYNARECQGFCNGFRMGMKLSCEVSGEAPDNPPGNFELFDCAFDNLLETEEWARICSEDPFIVEANTRLDAAVEALGPKISKARITELWEAIASRESAYVDASILYGIRFMDSIKSAAAHQSVFMGHIRSRMDKRQG